MPARTMSSEATTFLSRITQPLVAQHPGKSGIYPLRSGRDALLARMALAHRAERSLDVQYYIWQPDQTGLLLAARLLDAADRGVRVRLLLDDLGRTPSDRTLRALDSHPQVEVRLFNPLTLRTARQLGMILEFPRINRRMHNKSFTADGQRTIVGGRNVGDEYFEARTDVEFADLDVLAVGPVVQEVAESFELFWVSHASVPIVPLTRERARPGELARLRKRLRANAQSPRVSEYRHELRERPLARWPEQKIDFVWGPARTLFDHPDKIAGGTAAGAHLAPQLLPHVSAARREVLLVSPYFVPGRLGFELIAALRQRGVRVVVLTNSLASTDVRLVHGAYQHYRERLLRLGVELYEAKPTVLRKRRLRRGLWIGASTRASMHAKTFITDRRWVFVGSLNLDPRSLWLNTEIGVLFENPQLAERMAERTIEELAINAYRLELSAQGLRWIGEGDGQREIFRHEPQTTWWQRTWVRAVRWLPIESQL